MSDREAHTAPVSRDGLVSVIIPNYNGERFIEATLDSVYAQSHRPLEVIVVDDGSSDGSWDLLHRLQADTYPDLIVLCHDGHENRGETISRALGLSIASGRFVAFLDGDDLFLPGKLDRQVMALERHPDVVLCHTAIHVVGDLNRAAYFQAHFNSNPSSPYAFSRQSEYLIRNRICNSSVLMRADALRSISFATKIVLGFGDWLCWGLLCQRGKFLYLEECLTAYRVHSESKTSAFAANKQRRLFAFLEFKLALLARVEGLMPSLRVLCSVCETIRQLLVEYLWDPAGHRYGNPAIRVNPSVRSMLVIGRVCRALRSVSVAAGGRRGIG